MPAPRQVPHGDVLRTFGQRAEVHHGVGDGRLDQLPLLGVRVVDIEGLGDVGEQALARPGESAGPAHVGYARLVPLCHLAQHGVVVCYGPPTSQNPTFFMLLHWKWW